MPTVVFDANGTLFDLAPVRSAIGGGDRFEAFFQRVLHSAATLTFAGAWAAFDEIAATALATTCATLDLADVDQPSVLAAFAELRPFPDAPAAVAAAGSVAILTNSSEASTRRLVARASLDIGEIVSCEAIREYKPAPQPYQLAEERLGDYVLVSRHGWDVVGARAARVRAIWVRDDEVAWPFPSTDAGETADDLVSAVRVVSES